MIHIDASQLDHRRLNEQIRHSPGTLRITGCLGQRFIGAGAERGWLEITGTPGNALGAYLDGACIEVRGNAQDAVGDTMNDGRIIVHGSIGDAAGYAMRGGEIYVQGDAGYRAGIHMKAYGDKVPALVIGGKAGSSICAQTAGACACPSRSMRALPERTTSPRSGNMWRTTAHFSEGIGTPSWLRPLR